MLIRRNCWIECLNIRNKSYQQFLSFNLSLIPLKVRRQASSRHIISKRNRIVLQLYKASKPHPQRKIKAGEVLLWIYCQVFSQLSRTKLIRMIHLPRQSWRPTRNNKTCNRKISFSTNNLLSLNLLQISILTSQAISLIVSQSYNIVLKILDKRQRK